MYGQDLLLPVLNRLRDKFCVLIGDSCQLPPVMGMAINWDADSDFFKKYPIAHKCEGSETIRIVRFEPNPNEVISEQEQQQQRNFCQLLLMLRQVIAQQMRLKRKTDKNVSSKIKPEWLEMWYNKISKSICIESELSFDTVLATLVEAQRFVNSLIAWLRQGDNFYELFVDEFVNGEVAHALARATKRVNKFFYTFQLPIVIGYENKFNFEVFDHVAAHGLIERGQQNCWRAGKGGGHVVIRNVIMFSADADAKQMALVQSNTVSNLMNNRNILSPGMFIRCRENDSSMGTFNGQVGIFIGFFYRDDDEYDPPLFDVLHMATLSGQQSNYRSQKGHQQQLLSDEITVVKFRHRLTSPDMRTIAKNMVMVFYDVEARKLKSCGPAVRYLCEQCERDRRNQIQSTTRAPCSFHGGNKRPVQYMCFNWTSNYAQTVFCVQGATLANEKMYLLGDKVLKNNILRTLYVVLSRCRSSQQIHVDKAFLLKALRAIFNQPVATIDEKLTALLSK